MCLHVQRVYHLSSLVWPDRTFCMCCRYTQNAYFSRTSVSKSTSIYRGYKPTCRVVDSCASQIRIVALQIKEVTVSVFHLPDLAGHTVPSVNRMCHFEGMVLQNLEKLSL